MRDARPWLRFSDLRRMPLIRQATITECGLACIAMIASYFGAREDLGSLRRRFGVSLQGATLESLLATGEALGLSPRALRCGLDEIRRLRTPCILHWGLDHFVVLDKVMRRGLRVHDPARGRLVVPFEEADKAFTGVALELMPGADFRRQRRLLRRLRLADLVEFDRGFASMFGATLLLALVSELLLLASPFYLQSVIDQVLLRGDYRLLDVLVLGFAVLAVFQLLAGALRQLTSQFLSQTTVFDLSSRVLRHLLHLPVSYFRARSLGDVQQRMQSLTRIQAFVTEAAPALVLDVFFLVLVSFMLLSYAPTLAATIFAVTGGYALWRLAIYPKTLAQSDELVRAEAATQSHLLESLRVTQSIKLLAGESHRMRGWQENFARRVNAQVRLGNLVIADRGVHRVAVQGLHLGIVFLLARRVMAGEMSIGMLSAFVAYTGMFVTRVGGVINRIFEYCLLRVPLDRLADIVFAEREPAAETPRDLPRMAGNVTASEIVFTYAGNRRPVLEGISLRVTAGEFVAIRGRSGCGKSTLLHLLAGIEAPTSGALFFDDRPAADWPLPLLRRQLGTVFQDDALVSGSIEDNIALFATSCDPRRVRRAAEGAIIDADIAGLPMGYHTRIGDLGAALSTGQVQRILLARALYRRPRLLLLDEFTSGLDEDTERLVVATLARLRVTRVVVTHSPVVLRAADRVIDLEATCGTPAARLASGSGL